MKINKMIMKNNYGYWEDEEKEEEKVKEDENELENLERKEDSNLKDNNDNLISSGWIE